MFYYLIILIGRYSVQFKWYVFCFSKVTAIIADIRLRIDLYPLAKDAS